MVNLPLRPVALPDAAERAYATWVGELDEKLGAKDADWYAVCRDTLVELCAPGADLAERLADPAVPAATKAMLATLDPRTFTSVPADLSPDRYAFV